MIFERGLRVEAGETAAEYRCGVIVDVDDDDERAQVNWDGLDVVWEDLEGLRLEGTRPMRNYLKDYRCAKCAAVGLKLWRPVHGLDGWLCASCATKKELPRLAAEREKRPHLYSGQLWPFDEDGVFVFSRGDQFGDLLPAVRRGGLAPRRRVVPLLRLEGPAY